MGRTLLARLLGTGSGAVRTLINDLDKEKILTVEPTGCRLTEKGFKLYEQIVEKIPLITQLDAGRLSVARCDAGAIVKNASSQLRLGIEQRDAAVRVGAKGATTLIFQERRFEIPMGSRDCAHDYPDEVWDRLASAFKPENGDVIVVSSADDSDTALYGALAGALALLEKA
ncbi:MAG: DUF4443 domain-containing protein [Thaumarchaeota archaeon]|nr:DUF4443 domain-containing protein [Nitrososphaerota archaeon]